MSYPELIRVYANFVVSHLAFTPGFEASEPQLYQISILPRVRMQLVFIWALFALSSYSAAAQDLKPSTAWKVNPPSIPDYKKY